MKKYRKLLAAVLAGAMTVAMSAGVQAAAEDGYIVKATNTEAKSSDNDFVIAIEGSVSSMDPANIPDTSAISATRGVYENLVQFNEDQEIVGQLAKSWEVSDDSLTYTFKLQEGVKFHDGTDFNSAAIKANYDRVVDEKNKLRQRRTFIVAQNDGTEKERVASIETPDDYTVIFTLSEPWSPFINRLTQFCIISPAALEEYGNDIMNHPCGTGPYICTEWEEGDHTSFKRNEDYWGEKPGVDTVTIKEVPEAGSRTAMLQTGEADMIYPTPADQIEAIKSVDDVNVLTADSNIMRYVTLNMDLPELQDQKVRQAMNYAIDKDAYIALMYSGNGKPATSIVPSIIGGYEEQTPYTYDVEKAKELMKEAGYEDGFKLTLWGDNTTQEIKGMTFVKQQLAQIGIEVEVMPMESATVNDKIYVEKDEAEINMWYVNWSASDFTMDGSVRSLLYSTMCPPTSANTAYYNNPDFDKLLDEGLHTADLEEQAKVYSEAQKMAWDAAPWLFLGNDQIIYSTKSYVSGVYVAPDGAFNFAHAQLAQ
ncbi:glutathione ABC transporter substrate-binding protein [Blautia schinkii]|nr:glutathione ABC transporter substrate-binding protein [Blautia schinkii]